MLIFLSVLKKCPFDHTVLIISVKLKFDRYFFFFSCQKIRASFYLTWRHTERIFVLKLSTNSGKTRKNMCLFDTFVSLNKRFVWFCVPHCTLSKLFLRSKFFTTATKTSKNFSTWSHCDNYVLQWWVDLEDELSWLFTNRLSATRSMKVKRMGITEILRRIWLFSAYKIKSSECFSKQPIQLISNSTCVS